MRKSVLVLVSAAALLMPATPAVAVSATPVAEVMKMQLERGANRACPANSVKVVTATLTVKRGRIAHPGKFTLKLKNGNREAQRGWVVIGSNRRTAEYYLALPRTTQFKKGRAHPLRFKLNRKEAIPMVHVKNDCLEKLE